MRIALYARVRRQSEVEQTALMAEQLAHLRDWAQQHGHTIVRDYVDLGVSTCWRRPIFDAMVRATLARPRTFDAIVVQFVDRLLRDTRQFLDLKRQLDANGVALIVTSCSIDEVTINTVAAALPPALNDVEKERRRLARSTYRRNRTLQRKKKRSKGGHDGDASSAPSTLRIKSSQLAGNQDQTFGSLSPDNKSHD